MTCIKDLINTNFIKVEQSIISITSAKANLKPLDESIVYSNKELLPYEMLMMRFERALEIICNIFFRAVEMAEYGSLSNETPSCIARMKQLSLITSEELWMGMINNRPGVTSVLHLEKHIKLCNEILTSYIDELNELCLRVAKRYPLKQT